MEVGDAGQLLNSVLVTWLCNLILGSQKAIENEGII